MLDRPLSVRTRGGARGTRSAAGKVRRRSSRRWRFLPSARTRRRWWRIFRRRSTVTKWILVLGVLAIACVAVNWIYQVARKPSELFFPVSGTLYKTPAETWRQYAPLFQEYSTSVMTPELLAAIAQVEGSGNPVARTYWRWSWTRQPFEMYRPASRMAPLPRRDAFVSAITRSSRMVPGMIGDPVGSIAFTRGYCPVTRWNSLRLTWIAA